MRNPSGFGSVYKLGGQRRKPWTARITVSHDMGKFKYKYLGYYETQQEAMIALAEYNRDPYSIEGRNTTLKDVFDRFLADQKQKVKNRTYIGYMTAYRALEPLHGAKLKDLSLAKVQTHFDTCGRPYASLCQMKRALCQVLDYAMKFDLVDKNIARRVDVDKHKASLTKHEKVIFTAEEIDKVWKLAETDRMAMIVIVMLYTGVRAMEMCSAQEVLYSHMLSQ